MVKTAETYHVPVLLNESIDGLNIQPGGIYVDVTFGGGGHSKEILARINGNGHLYSFDQDADAERNVVANKDFTFVCSNFRYLKNWMRYYGVDGIDGLLADLGVSSHHFDDETRGFSFRYDSPLDMRMNKRAGKTAADIVNDYEESKLADIRLGGGTGFLTKTVYYALAPKEEGRTVLAEFFDKVLFTRRSCHHHMTKDDKLTPRTLKLAWVHDDCQILGLAAVKEVTSC